MSLGRAWGRELLRAGGASLLAPAAVLAALVLLALSGGFGHLGALGEAFAGPSLPSVPGTPSTPLARHRPRPTAVEVALAANPVATDSGQGALGSRTASSGGPAAHARPPGPSGGSGAHRPAPPRTGGPPGTPPSRPPSGTRPPGAHPTLIDGVVAVGTSASKRVPAPVGTLATKTLQSVGETLDGLLAPPPAPTRRVLGGLLSRMNGP